MHIDDATSFIVDFLRKPRSSDGHSTYGNEIFLPSVISAYLREIERLPEHLIASRVRELSPAFYDAAWELCRRGVLRPSVLKYEDQGLANGSGYSVTDFGRSWIAKDAPAFVLVDPGRFGELFKSLSVHLGRGFLQRANEAALCYKYGGYLACCAMCGAAAESILLAVAIAKSGDENSVLSSYHAASGRRKVVEQIVGKAETAISGPFRSAVGLLSYWRDDAAHGVTSTISEIEAHEALARLLRFAQFATDNWNKLID